MNKLNLSYDGVWNDEEKAWKGTLTFQQVYPLVLNALPPKTWPLPFASVRRKTQFVPDQRRTCSPPLSNALLIG